MQEKIALCDHVGPYLSRGERRDLFHQGLDPALQFRLWDLPLLAQRKEAGTGALGRQGPTLDGYR